ncbi:tetratricopeptide repeat protein [Microbacterium sp. SLBN-146]|uniref:tetratricopeptide repeat protein n=1 Tax=Microbacterium sp. SLBN-146 TaxID=2768457 RepID=UPI00114EA2E1|nr:tetratricopeptide repeat protein [Microbacterium sp. SLBN-146]
MTGEEDLRAFAAAWQDTKDGQTGSRYVDALHAEGRSDEALAVCRDLWDLGYVVGLTEAAWVEHDQGDYSAALASMTAALDHLEGDERLYAVGVVGCWRWHHFNDAMAEPLLREGMAHYGSAWAGLGTLLRATGRQEECEEVLRAGVTAGVLECMIPLANILSRRGERAEAEVLYRRGYDLGDAHSAWNLAIDLADAGRLEEASDWRWKAAAGGDELAIQHLIDEAVSDDH